MDETADEAARGNAGRGFDHDRGGDGAGDHHGGAVSDDDAGVDEHECREHHGFYGARGDRHHEHGDWMKAGAGGQP